MPAKPCPENLQQLALLHAVDLIAAAQKGETLSEENLWGKKVKQTEA